MKRPCTCGEIARRYPRQCAATATAASSSPSWRKLRHVQYADARIHGKNRKNYQEMGEVGANGSPEARIRWNPQHYSGSARQCTFISRTVIILDERYMLQNENSARSILTYMDISLLLVFSKFSKRHYDILNIFLNVIQKSNIILFK